jgi:predicted tellurium resistance membrane protein TerC
MILAIVIAIIVMMFSSRSIGAFVDKHPTIKMLALSFLVMIGVTLIARIRVPHSEDISISPWLFRSQ